MPSKVSNIVGSVGTKLLIVMLALAATTAAAIISSHVATNRIGDQVSRLTAENVPTVRRSTQLAIDFGDMRAELIDFLLARSPEELETHLGHFVEYLDTSNRNLITADPALSQEIGPLITAIQTQMQVPVEARKVEFARRADVAEAVQNLGTVGSQVSALLHKRIEYAVQSLQIGGQNTTDDVSASLDRLVKRDFAAVRLVLDVRGDLALLSGVALAKAANPPIELLETLQEIGNAALQSLDSKMPALLAVRGMDKHAGLITQARDLFATLLTGGPPAAAQNRAAILSTSTSVTDELSTILAEITQSLNKASNDTSARNRASIDGLLENDVADLRDLMLLDVAVKDLRVACLEIVQIADPAAIPAARETLKRLTDHLASLSKGADAVLSKPISALIQIADPAIGIAQHHLGMLQTRDEATQKLWETKDFVTSRVEEILAIAERELLGIDTASAAITAEIDRTRIMETVILITSFVIILLSIPFAYFTILRPLRSAAKATEAVAGGNLAVVDTLRESGGEVGILVRALRVFRDGLVEKARLEQEERTSSAARIEAERRAVQERHEQEGRERQRIEAQDRAQKELKAAEEAKLEALRRTAEESRLERLAAQNEVVTALADGLRKLSEGDLRAQIHTQFAEGYDELRLDFNAAIMSLEELIGSIRRSVESIHGGSGEISHAAADLSRRTEQTAATLEQSAAALTELTASVESAAEGATDAARIVETARANAERSDEVVREAVRAMGAIEDSSRKISTIIGVIDDIAFQTNLLALNAGVEAARAGEAGRGFAVVASEVRALSQRSSDAAREIGTLISDSGRQVHRGVDLVGQAGEALRGIVQSVKEISQHVNTIAISAREQSTGISEINLAIGQLDQATQQNAAMVEQTTAASLTLTDEASALAETVARFSTPNPADSQRQDTRSQWLNAS